MDSSLIHLILESNVVNFLIAVILLFWFFTRELPKLRGERKSEITKEIDEARAARELAELKLKELEAKLSKAQIESKNIIEEGKKAAEQIRHEILESAKDQISKMQNSAEKEIESKKNLAMQSLRRTLTEEAIKLVESMIKEENKKKEFVASIEKQFLKELNSMN
jgi:F-type H+-transporting ATPase subunit b